MAKDDSVRTPNVWVGAVQRTLVELAGGIARRALVSELDAHSAEYGPDRLPCTRAGAERA